MRTETQQSWWRQLGAISQGMLFLDGHIATAEAAATQRNTIDTERAAGKDPARATAAARQAEYARQARQMTALSLFR
jgi:hypothetical protein